MTEKEVKSIIEGCKTEKQIIAKLNKYKISFENATDEYGYLNIKIYSDNGYIRIYKPYRSKELKTQTFTPCKMEYSGIPTFFISNSYF